MGKATRSICNLRGPLGAASPPPARAAEAQQAGPGAAPASDCQGSDRHGSDCQVSDRQVSDQVPRPGPATVSHLMRRDLWPGATLSAVQLSIIHSKNLVEFVEIFGLEFRNIFFKLETFRNISETFKDYWNY